MNKTHRIVWSEARQGYVVAHENAAACGKPSSTRKTLAVAVSAALMGLGASQASAQTVGQVWTSGSINNSAAIVGTNIGIKALSQTITGSISNSGTISGGVGNDAIAIDHSTITGGITNSGTLVGQILFSTSQMSGAIVNAAGGTIAGNVNASSNANVGGLTNAGTITGSVSLYANGNVVNDATGLIQKSSTVWDASGFVSNAGTISSTSNDALTIKVGRVSQGFTNTGKISTTVANKWGFVVRSSPLVAGAVAIDIQAGTISGGAGGGGIYIKNFSTVVGSGHAIKTGASAVVGNILIENSTVDGKLSILSSSNVTLSGSSSVLALPSGPSTSTIAGSFTTNGSGETLRFAVDSGGPQGGLHVAGPIAIGSGGSTIDLRLASGIGPIYPGTLDDLLVGSTLTGTNVLSVRDNSALYDFTLEDNGTSLLARVQLSTSACGTGATVTGSVAGLCEVAFDRPNLTVASGAVISGGSIGGTITYGILAFPGSYTGSIINNGTLSVVANMSKGVGISLDGTTLTGSIVNNGLIDASPGNTVSGTAISLINSTLTGSISNNAGKTLSAFASGGIVISKSTVTGGITNSGLITDSAWAGVAVSSGSLVASGIRNLAGGTISGGSYGITIGDTSNVTGGLVNNGVISGLSSGGLNVGSKSSLTGGFTNSGTISSDVDGIYLSGAITGGLTNSGTISNTTSGTIGGSGHAIFVDGGTLDSLVIAGNTAKFIGEVSAPDTPVTVATGAVYTMDNGQLFTLNGTSTGFTVSGALAVDVGATGTISGAYTQNTSGTFRTKATTSSDFGKLVVSGTATLPAAAKFDVVTGNAATCGGITVGTTLSGVLSATTLTSTDFSVTDDCTNVDFTAVQSGNGINLVAIAPAPSTWVVTGASDGNGTVSCASPVANNGYATCTGTASGGYALSSATGCGTTTVSGTTITAGPVTAACTVTGTFALTAVNGTCSGANGTTVTSAPAASCSAGTASGVSTGNTAYSWTCAGIGVGTTDSCSATRNYVVSSSAGANGSISTSQNVAYNATPSFTVTANTGYTIQSVTGCSGTLSGGTYTTAAITASCAVSASFVANVAPTFVGATTALTVAQGASATDVKGLLHASDSDASQTLTWTQSSAPTHGTLNITSATAASGSADVTPGGTITYAPTAGYVGSDSFTVQVSDGTATATRTITVTVGSALTVTVGALTLNSMTVGTAYTSQSFAGAGGYGAYTYTVSAGILPAGLSLNASTGALTGTPTTAGAYSFTIRAVDSSTGTGAPFAGTRAFSGTVTAANTAPTFVGATTTLTVAQGASATDVKALLHASDSDASQTLTWTQNAAPSHGTLSITSATAASGSADVTPGGTITYTPTAGYVGSDSFTVQVSDGTASATRVINVTVSAPTVTVGALTLNSMTVGTVFVSQSFAGAGGYGAYTYTVSAGTLPAGLSLNASTGALTGTPTTASAYSFTIQATDSSTLTAFSGTRAFSGTVAAANTAPTFVGATTALTVAQGASATDVKGLLHASDSDASQTLTWTQNAAPTHGTLAITSATAASGSADVTPGGTITYTPTAGYVGSDSFTMQVSDGTATATRSISVTVSAANTSQANIPTTANGVTASMSVSGCTSINSAAFAAPTSGAPSNTTFPFGMLGFTLNGCISGPVTVTVTYSQPLSSGATFYKNMNGTYAPYTAALGANTVTFSLRDGYEGDADLAVNGSIRDPGGIGVPSNAAQPIPTLSEWGLIFLSSLMAMFGMTQARRRRGG